VGKFFQRCQEDFQCDRCGAMVRGSGYTNHCPQCLWSRHVDINPGDRAASCGGLMEPIAIEMKKGNYVILHQCTRCGWQRRNKTAIDDNFEAILAVARG